MSKRADPYRKQYADAFTAYLAAPTEDALRAAYELGRDAVGGALSVLELASIHHEVLCRHLAGAHGRADVDRVAAAAGDFFLESLSAFEIVQRGFREARDAVLLEQRQTALVRQLSKFLADASLAVDAGESIEEVLQLIAEQTREVIGAACCVATVRLDDVARTLEAICHSPEDGGWREWVAATRLAEAYASVRPARGVLRTTCDALAQDPAGVAIAASGRPLRAWLAVPLTRLDGQELGLIHLFDKDRGDFSEIDGEILVQLAQMASAAIERAQLYSRGWNRPA